MSVIEQLRPDVRIQDRRSGRERVVERVEVRGPVVKIWFQDPQRGTPELMHYRLAELEERFEVVEASATLFRADPEVVRLVAEAYRLQHAFLFNPVFATETSLIDPLPHQLLAVYGLKGSKEEGVEDRPGMLDHPRLRFLLADDAGAGKTIMAGLYIREMLLRRLIRRVLIVPPAGLVGNWKRELQNLFRLHFRIITSHEARDGNPFVDPRNTQAIISVDTASRERMKELLQDAPPYDLVVFDEAHKLSARRERDLTVHRTERYKLAEAVAIQGRHLLLLTATPHMGKDDPYYFLWRLLLPTLLSSQEAFNRLSRADKQPHLLRRMKEEMVRFDETDIYKKRTSQTVGYPLARGSASSTPGFDDLDEAEQVRLVTEADEVSEKALYLRVTHYCQEHYNRALQVNRGAAGLAMSVLQRRLASSIRAISRSLERRLEKLETALRLVEQGLLTEEDLAAAQRILPASYLRDVTTADEEEVEDGVEAGERQEEALAGATVCADEGELRIEIGEVRRLVQLATMVAEELQGQESKFEELWEALKAYPDDKVLIFTEHKDTMTFLIERLEGLGHAGKVACIHGGKPHEERDKEVDRFAAEDGARYLVATDAAGEGINLQFCRLMVNYDIPWNPARIEQRMGRIHRYGQEHPVVLLNLVSRDTREGRVLLVLLDKLQKIREELGDDKVFDIIGQQFDEEPLQDLIRRAVLEGKDREVAAEVDRKVTKERAADQARQTRDLVACGEVRALLDGLRRSREAAELKRMMPAYVRDYFLKAARLVGIGVQGQEREVFSLSPCPESVRLAAAAYPEAFRGSYTFDSRRAMPRPFRPPKAVYLHPGEPVFEEVTTLLLGQHDDDAQQGAVFFDRRSAEPYLFYLARVTVLGISQPGTPADQDTSILKEAVVGVRVGADGTCLEVPAHTLLLLLPVQHGEEPERPADLVNRATDISAVETFMYDRHGVPLELQLREEARRQLPRRQGQLRAACELHKTELLRTKRKLKEAVARGEPVAAAHLKKCVEDYKSLDARMAQNLADLEAEMEGIHLGPVTIYARALVLPMPLSLGGGGGEDQDPEDKKRTEAIAMAEARRYEEDQGSEVEDVSDPARGEGCDLISVNSDGEVRFIEVKGRKRTGHVNLSANEWAQAQNHGPAYWLYVVYDCDTTPRLKRIQDPASRGIGKPRGEVVISAQEILDAEEEVARP